MATRKKPKCKSCDSLFAIHSGHVPLLLPCDHTICRNCYAQNGLKCSECDWSSGKDTLDTDDLELDIFCLGLVTSTAKGSNRTLDYLKFTKPQLKPEEPILSCYECGKSTTYKCNDCDEVYCKSCFSSCHIGKKLATHQFINVGEQSDDSFCVDHRNQRYINFCTDCKKQLCHLCAHSESHNTSLIKELNQSLDSSTVLQKAELILLKLENEIKSVQETKTSIVERVQRITDNINSEFLELHGLLQNKENQLILGLLAHVEPIIHDIHSEEESIEAAITDANKVIAALTEFAFEPSDNIPIEYFAESASERFDKMMKGGKMRYFYEFSNSLGAVKRFTDGKCQEFKKQVNIQFGDVNFKALLKTAGIDVESGHLGSNTSAHTMVPDKMMKKKVPKLAPSPMFSSKQSPSDNRKYSAIQSPQAQLFEFEKTLLSIANVDTENPSRVQGVSKFEGTRQVRLPQDKHESVETGIYRVTHFYALHSFSVQSVESLEQQEEFQKQLNEMAREAKVVQSNDVSVGGIYLVQAHRTTNWMRGKVLNSRNSCFNVMLIDRGKRAAVAETQIRNIDDPEIRDMKDNGYVCMLTGISGGKAVVPEETINFAKKLLVGQTFTVIFDLSFTRTDGIVSVDLIMEQGQFTTSVRDILVATNMVQSFPYGNQSNKKFVETKKNLIKTDTRKLHVKEQRLNETIKILHIDSIREYYAISANDVRDVKHIQDELNAAYKKDADNLKLYVPAVNMICAAEVNGKWQRARITNVSNSGEHGVFLVDCGERKTVHWKHLRILEDHFLSVPQCVHRLDLFESSPEQVSQLDVVGALQKFREIQRQFDQYELKKNSKGEVVLYAKDKNRTICVSTEILKTSSSRIINEPEELVPFVSSANQYGAVNPQPKVAKGNRLKVKLMHTVSPEEFYISLDSRLGEIAMLQENVQKYAEESKNKHNETNWKTGDFCYAMYAKRWYRGVIVKMSGNVCTIFLRDIGKSIEIQKSTLLKTDVRDNLESGVIKCCLAFIKPANLSWSQTAIDKLKSFGKSELYISLPDIEVSPSSMPVVLWLIINEKSHDMFGSKITRWQDLNLLLAHYGLARCTLAMDEIRSFPMQPNSDKYSDTAMIDDLIILSQNSEDDNANSSEYYSYPMRWKKAEPIDSNRFEYLPTHIDENLTIFALEAEKRLKLQQMSAAINKEMSVRDCTVTNWKLHDICLARYINGEYHRGEVMNVHTQIEKCKVLFVDFGDEQTVNFYDMTKAIRYGDVPILTTQFRLANIQPVDKVWSPRLIKFCTNQIVNKVCTIQVEKTVANALKTNSPFECKIYPKDSSLHLAHILLSERANEVQAVEQPRMNRQKEYEIEQDRLKRTRTKSDDSVHIDSKSLRGFEDFQKCYDKNKLVVPSFEPLEKHSDDENDPPYKPYPRLRSKRNPFPKVGINSTMSDEEGLESYFKFQLVKKLFTFYPVKTEDRMPCRVIRVVDPVTVLLTLDTTTVHKMLAKISDTIGTSVNNPRLVFNSTVEKHKPCVAFYNDLWLRGVVYDVTNDGFNILFADQFAEATISKNHVYPLDPLLAHEPILCFEAKLKGLTPPPRSRKNDICNPLKELMMDKNPLLFAKVRSERNGIPEVKIYANRDAEMPIYQTLIDNHFYKKV